MADYHIHRLGILLLAETDCSANLVLLARVTETTRMTAQKQSWPSFASIISALSIMLYCAGFLRVKLELNEQKKRINVLENFAAQTAKPLSDNAKLANVIKNVPGKYVFSLVT